MINIWEVKETNNMVEQENLDVRTITIGISLLDCIDSDLQKLNDNIYNKITTVAKDLAAVGEKIEREFGIPIVNKRISVTPIALVGGACNDLIKLQCFQIACFHSFGILFILGSVTVRPISKNHSFSAVYPDGSRRIVRPQQPACSNYPPRF